MNANVVTCVFVLCVSLAAHYGCANRVAAQEVPLKSTLVAQLASRNQAPVLEDVSSKPLFDADFDWSEQKRVWRVIGDLFKSAEENWDTLTANISKEDYCVTVITFNGSKYNWTVGDVCRKVISVTLSDAYFRSLEPQTRELYVKFRQPDFARNSKRLKQWLDARQGKSLVELQADACDWAIQRLAQRDEKDDWTDKDQDRWSAAIKKTGETLRSGGAAISTEGFGHEEFKPYRKGPGSE